MVDTTILFNILQGQLQSYIIVYFRWGRGHPEEYTDAMNLGEERFDSIDSDKKPRAGQILWIRGLTRLQTQVSVVILIDLI